MNVVYSGANAEIFIIPYIATDSSHSSFIPVKDFLLFDGLDSITISSARTSSPLFPLGYKNATTFVEGAEINRVKLSFTDNNENPFIDLFDFMLKSKYDTKGYRKSRHSDLSHGEYNREINEFANSSVDQIITNVGSLSGTTTNPFDLWMYVQGEYSSLTVVVFGIKIDTSTTARDVYNKNLRLAEGTALFCMDSMSGKELFNFMMTTEDYGDSIAKFMEATNDSASLPFKNGLK